MICSNRELILASSSRYRQQQLLQLGVKFKAISPKLDEQPQQGETPKHFALRMAQQKAAKIAAQHQSAIVIAADQVCQFKQQIIGKPHTHQAAVQQLSDFSAQQVLFHSALSVQCLELQQIINSSTLTTVQFRELQAQEIEAYLKADQAYDCAGSFKIESKGLLLMQKVQSDDPSALIGLPIISLNHALQQINATPY